MAAIPPPEGMTEEDYDSIHAAVVETVRGRWFLAEYARRSRMDEVQEMLAAIGRLEATVTSQRALPPPGETPPHARLLTQRAGEIATRLEEIVEDLRDSGADPYLCDDLETQVRALAGLPKGQAPEPAPAASPRTFAAEVRAALAVPLEKAGLERIEDVPQEAQPSWVASGPPLPAAPQPFEAPPQPRDTPAEAADPRVAALAALVAIDRLSLSEKLALFA